MSSILDDMHRLGDILRENGYATREPAREMTLADHRAIEAEAAPEKPALEFSGQRIADYVLESQPALRRILQNDGMLDLVRYDLASAAWEGYMAGLRAGRSS